ncbi:ribosomal protein L1 [Ascobolus immersus RN42]|uniref:Ribosomal protein L1 n=1 Tax=Ascobolus immersus RN42 TaxID=1160509 RepID=A0A3N4HHL5_ASCIM|nr:ribosomal protein L1 [Ascobolus immersus RN42]
MPPRLPHPRLPALTSTLLFRPTLTTTLNATPLLARLASGKSAATKEKEAAARKKKKSRPTFRQFDLRDMDQYSLVEAVRYLRAFEAGQDPATVKYDLAVKIKTNRSGPVVKSMIKLPVPVRSDTRICVIAKDKVAQKAREAGAVIAGYEEVIQDILNEKIDFDLCIAHDAVAADFAKKVGRILGPRGLMPNVKMGTIVKDPAAAISDLTGKSEFKERLGVVRLPIGQLGFSEEQLAANIKAFMAVLKKELKRLSYQSEKSVYEVVLSSTHGPGLSLNGDLRPAEEVKAEALAKLEAEAGQQEAVAA